YPRQLERLVDDADLRRRLGENARAYAREHFDPNRNARRFRAIFESMLERPKRERPPLPGLGEPAARRFVRSMGHLAGPFAISLEGARLHGHDAVIAAEREIAASSGVVAQAEGGVIHHRNTFPDDPHLRLWSGLIAEHRGTPELAARELDFAARHGVHRES
ncbi:MAG: glycosyltransferase, partial [Phycisphaerales bacterium]